MTNQWVEKPVRLLFRIGEIPLFSVPFHALVYNSHFTDLLGENIDSPCSFESVPHTIEALHIPSHPIKDKLPRFTSMPDCVRYVPLQYRRYYIDLRGTFQEYVKKFSAKSRYNLS